MLHSLKYVVVFNITGRTLKNQINFKPGITKIIGENEAGKSVVFEMIRYALFGSDALRGTMSDYDKLDVELKLEIKGKLYHIIRKGTKATVNINEAVGTTACNKYLREKLGFGMDVFDISANANQGELDKFTKDIKPTARRKLVDDITGLDQFEKVEKDCRDEANGFKKVAEAFEQQLVEPEKPEKPDDYEPSNILQERMNQEIRNETLRSQFVERSAPDAPVQPRGSEEAIEYEEDREADTRLRQSLEKQLLALPVPDNRYTRDELLEFKASVEQALRGPLPDIDPELLEQWRHDHYALMHSDGPLKCPECGHLISGKELPERPPMALDEINEEFNRYDRWQGYSYDESLPESPFSMEQITRELKLLDAQGEREHLEKQIENLGPAMVSRAEEAAAWLTYNQAQVLFEQERKLYEDFLQKKAVIEALPKPEPLLREKLDMATRYENLMERYLAAKEVYDAQKLKAQTAKDKRDDYKRGSEALRDIRKEVKQYLIPSLSKVSSSLLSEMTAGERRSIFIDDDFEIYVDKQHVRTLSGSGVSVVNLALRIALGQVLTQSVIPFFLADEIDANMAAKRTEATHQSLHRLKSRLKQIIVITHKEFESDHTICLT